MTNFIFKSQWTFKKISNQLEMILSELRHQRQDNVQILFLINKLITAQNLQKQVDDYFDEDDPDIGEAHPGRDLPLEDNTKDIPDVEQ